MERKEYYRIKDGVYRALLLSKGKEVSKHLRKAIWQIQDNQNSIYDWVPISCFESNKLRLQTILQALEVYLEAKSEKGCILVRIRKNCIIQADWGYERNQKGGSDV